MSGQEYREEPVDPEGLTATTGVDFTLASYGMNTDQEIRLAAIKIVNDTHGIHRDRHITLADTIAQYIKTGIVPEKEEGS